jgi:hypothetical protein
MSMLHRDRKRSGLRIAQAASNLGITPAANRRLEEEEAWPSFETYDRICKLFRLAADVRERPVAFRHKVVSVAGGQSAKRFTKGKR